VIFGYPIKIWGDNDATEGENDDGHSGAVFLLAKSH